ncbi:MAG: hypothetical protein JXR22_12490 [Prolixibacteraceae bacterium]|nr:hypothetical protein [Prolixibacteraceae bacterium]
MRIFVVLFCCLLISNVLMAQSSRTTHWLKHARWEMADEQGKIQSFDFDAAANLLEVFKAGQTISTVLETDQDAPETVLYLPGAAAFFSIQINGQPVTNELSDENFHAETGPAVQNGQFRLSIVFQQNTKVQEWYNLMEYAQFSLLNQVFICHFQTNEDSFFGGSLLEAMIRSVHDVDVDGKLVASVFDLRSKELLAENNNCAFARQGSESMVEVNFPDAKKLIKGEVYLLSLALLDKDQNDEIIDELILPIRF